MNSITEYLNPASFFGVTGNLVHEERSNFQHIQVYDTEQFGKALVIDGVFMTSVNEEFVYHECMVHPAANTFEVLGKAVVLGGGDGGIARELLKFTDDVTICELDERVVEVSKRYIDIDKGALQDDRVKIIYGDGMQSITNMNDVDLIVMDLTDPGTTADSLYSAESVRAIKKSLSNNGTMVMHLGSPVYHQNQVARLVSMLKNEFTNVKIMGAHMPLYGAYWMFAMASDTNSLDQIYQMLPSNRFLDDQGFYHISNIPKCYRI